MRYQSHRSDFETILSSLRISLSSKANMRLGAVQRAEYRNFNLCPHCKKQGKETFLWRFSEGFPMISRSDGETFHLLLADSPRSYPAELSSGRTNSLSLCFFYEHQATRNMTQAVTVLISGESGRGSLTYRQIESIADLLAADLMESSELPTLQILEAGELTDGAEAIDSLR
jgi:hypothetical protein